MNRSRAVLTDEIRKLVIHDWESETITHKGLSQRYNISPSTVRNILRGLTSKVGHSGAYGSQAQERSEKSSDRTSGDWHEHAEEYNIWNCMMSRCYRENSVSYKHYGGRGIRVCERWHSFWNFYEDMGPRPDKSYSIEREDNDGDYCPDNCVWLAKSKNTRRLVNGGCKKTRRKLARRSQEVIRWGME